MIDFEVLAELCGGMPAAVVTRAREFLRVATAKKALRVKDSTPAACFIVACRSLEEPVDVKHLSRLVGINARVVEQDVRRILGAVNVRSVIRATPASLCVRFGCTAIADRVTRVHAAYQAVGSAARAHRRRRSAELRPERPDLRGRESLRVQQTRQAPRGSRAASGRDVRAPAGVRRDRRVH
ncbi:hypothetical protein PINS_up012942 [Pythium insidiosum]|nr:hypothetical protein PINS_up012942 [Pythium insidiosum]